jgi:Ser/Thr protein kinase RdoA (MazF antagonist)
VTGQFVKRYPDEDARHRAEDNYRWLAGLLLLPQLRAAVGRDLCFERVDGRHASPADLPMLAAILGDVHGTAYSRQLCHARLGQPFQTPDGHMLPGFPAGRVDAVARELDAGRVPGARLTAAQAQRLLVGADGPAAFYKDANPRNFLITPAGVVVTVDFDDLTLAPFGYDLAKLVVALAMTHGPLPVTLTTAALAAYNTAAAAHSGTLPDVSRDELMNWAEIHHVLTSRYAADGRYAVQWDQLRLFSTRHLTRTP